MARPREFDENAVLQNIKGVFWEYGYEATSYGDLIEASGLHKGSLYAAFGDKRALYLRALADYFDYEVASAIALLTGDKGDGPTSGTDRVEVLLDAVIDAVEVKQDRRGCLLCNAAVDQAPHSDEVEEVVAKGFDQMQQAFEVAMAENKRGVARREAASLLNATYFGMRVMAKSGAPITMMKNARNAALKAVR